MRFGFPSDQDAAHEMPHATSRGQGNVWSSKITGLAWMLLVGAWFFVVFPTEPLYFENQNTKFLHGMALAGIGHLDRDWTANSIDVMPVFTGIVYALHVATPPFVAYLVQILLFAVFLHAVLEIARLATGRRMAGPAFSIVVGALIVVSQFSNGGARVWAGVAKQYLLGPALEPQSFGVFFLLAVVFFLKKRVEAALLLAAVPAIIHPGYVVPAGTLMLAFVLAAWLGPDKARRPRLPVIILALAAAAASMVYLGLRILPTDIESWQRANEILAKIRIPRHAVPAHWFDFDAGAKTVGCMLALWLVRQRCPDLFWIIAFCFGTAVSLTLLTIMLDSSELGMISPWRISVYLVPLGLAVLLGQAVAAGLDLSVGERTAFTHKALGGILALLAVAVTARGLIETAELYRHRVDPAHIVHMRETGEEETLYLTSPFDMNVRLESGLPQLVSWKSHPYKDVEVLEWFRRYKLAERVFRNPAIDCEALAEAVERYQATHLLVDDPAKAIGCNSAVQTFEEGGVRIFRLQS
ncbi:MAG: DUF6798 domain-containing protein [Geminicoccaceae bacterium]